MDAIANRNRYGQTEVRYGQADLLDDHVTRRGASVTADATSLMAESNDGNNTNSGFGYTSTAGRCRLN